MLCIQGAAEGSLWYYTLLLICRIRWSSGLRLMGSFYDVEQRFGLAGRMEEGFLPLLALNPKQVTPNKAKMTGLQVKTRGK